MKRLIQIVSYLIIVIFLTSCDTQPAKINSIVKEKAHVNKEPIISKQIKNDSKKRLMDITLTRLYKNFASLSRTMKDECFFEIHDVISKANMFSDISTSINDAISIHDDSLTAVATRLKKKLISVQIRDFPHMRKSYIKLANNILWEENIEITGKGKTITFTGGVFANNKNIKVFYDNLRWVLEKLRFQRANFKWYKNASEYTYYTITLQKDGDV